MTRLRKFLPSDLEKVMEIEKISFPKKIAYSKSHFEKLYREHPNGFLVAQLSEEVAGYTIGYVSNNSGYIDSLAVSPKYRGRGIGKKLTNLLLKHFKEKKAKVISLHARTNNKLGIDFFKRLGFKVSKTIKNYYRNGDDAYLMRKNI